MWYSSEGPVFDGTCQMYWGRVTQEWCESCQLLTRTPSQSAASATSLLIVRLLWGIRLDPLSWEQLNQLNTEIRCINKQCSAWGRTGMTQWHSHLDITLQLTPRAISTGQHCKALTHWHTHVPNDYLCAFKWKLFSKWQRYFSIDLYCNYKNYKTSVKSVIKGLIKVCNCEDGYIWCC